MESSKPDRWKEGDKTNSLCETCRTVVTATFKVAPLKYGNDTIPGVLQGFCDTCGEATCIPHQSSAVIKSFLEERKRRHGDSKVHE